MMVVSFNRMQTQQKPKGRRAKRPALRKGQRISRTFRLLLAYHYHPYFFKEAD